MDGEAAGPGALMCGIVGAAAFRGERLASGTIDRMQAVQVHRGPDHQAAWCTDALALGCARLSILDLSPAAHQPMISPDGARVLVYNGELYNFRRLRADLERRGVSFRSGGDTEVILQALALDGEAALPTFDGMFALAFLDRRENVLWLARDRAGIKPLHYLAEGSRFLFASEVKSIARALESGLAPDGERLRDLVSLGYPYGTTTPFRGVRTLEGGMRLRLDLATGEIDVRPFHRLLDGVVESAWAERARRTEGEVEQGLERALDESVAAHLASDAPVGVICSGGVDSSLISALAVRHAKGIELFHAAVEGADSEEPHARAVAKHLGAPLRVAPVAREDFLRAWPLAVWHNDFPSYHPNDGPLYLVCRLARERGCKVLLSGEGADELFGGYRVNLELRARDRWRRAASRAPAAVRRTMKAVAESRLLASSFPGFREFGDLSGLTALDRVNSVIAGEALFQGGSERLRRGLEIRERLAFVDEPERSAAAFLTERVFGHLGSLLLRNDRMGMMASVETRIPYLSNALLADWMPMPLRFRIAGGGHTGLKYLLKRIARRHLPPEIASRPKVGFGIPLSRFVRPAPALFEGGFLADALGIPAPRIAALCPDAHAFYRFASIELWGRFFFRGESPEEWSEWIARRC
jgi:asparagine synthase (glutamine-hydrolysing)